MNMKRRKFVRSLALLTALAAMPKIVFARAVEAFQAESVIFTNNHLTRRGVPIKDLDFSVTIGIRSETPVEGDEIRNFVEKWYDQVTATTGYKITSVEFQMFVPSKRVLEMKISAETIKNGSDEDWEPFLHRLTNYKGYMVGE